MITLAQSFVTSLDGTGPKAFGLFALMNGTFNNPDTGAGTQDLLVQQVPEPSSLLSVASGVIGMIGFAYRRRHLKV